MIFSEYILNFLNEEETIDMVKEIESTLTNIKKYKNTVNFVKNNMKKFAIKNKDLKSKKVLIYNETDTQTYSGLISALNKDGALFVQNADNIDIVNEIVSKKQTFIFRFCKTGASIEGYWGGNAKSRAEQTNFQEVGVLIWTHLLKNNKSSLSDFDAKKTKIFADSDDTTEKTIKFLESESLKLNGWNDQCRNAAQAILKVIPQIKTGNYEYHQGGDLFNSLRKKGQTLSKIPGAADKWNPSDIYFIKKGFDLSKYKTIEDLNGELGNFDKVIGVSLKGSSAGHGAISLNNIFKFLGLKTPSVSEMKIKDNKLNDKQIIEYKKLMKGVKAAAKHCPFKQGVIVYINNFCKYKLSKDIDEMIKHLEIESENWGNSIPITLAFLAELTSKELWERFAFWSYSLASSQLAVSASYYKADGNGNCKLIQSGGLDPDKFECKVCRIPLSKETNIIFDAVYDGAPQKLQFRSKGGKPQMTIWHTEEKVNHFMKISELQI